MAGDPGTELQLADWRRRVAALYVEVRALALTDPEAAWRCWIEVREQLYRTHPLSPVPSVSRPTFQARYWPYDATFRFQVRLEETTAAVSPTAGGFGGIAPLPLTLPNSGADVLAFHRIGSVAIPFALGERHLSVFWMEGYAGGLFLAFRDATNGIETYGAGRYLVDGAKSADLGGDPVAGTLILDFNFAYQPSCAFDPKWACPLAPSENRLDLSISAGERIA